ncbi:hypothetical protein [Pseudothauera rhizosphaerae]|uniref:Uncharacterized protein n=1 Tax=Pseudothauera rhizosphaerae TaxID=2565932 RepID=A0A4S4AU19_9RHOO|nr:hypothetical protein [Pseudothauera rhizosphaerae]THF63378.1 hypothetical protein E6O51_04770 [Pseudothauera rhizosphaerae]
MPRYSTLAGLIALSVAGLGVSRGDVAPPAFTPALCEQAPPAELLAIADWPLDGSAHGCDVVRQSAVRGEGAGAAEVVELSWSDFTVRAVEVVERTWNDLAPAAAATPPQAVAGGPSLSIHPALARNAALAAHVARMAEAARENWPRAPENEGDDAVPYWYGDLPVEAGEPPVVVAGVELKRVDAGAMDTLRGGFEMPGGLKVSFGVERLVYINGELASATRLTVADLGKLTGGSVNAAGLPALGSTVAVIQNGPNNTLIGNAVSSSALATVIQNSLNNQHIRTVTTIDVTANSLEMMRAQRLGESMRDVLRLR